MTISRWWKGEERLVIVYWSSLAILAVFHVIGLALDGAPTGAILVLNTISICVYAFCAFSIWQCAFNAKHRIWGYLARTQVTFGVISTVGLLLKGAS